MRRARRDFTLSFVSLVPVLGGGCGIIGVACSGIGAVFCGEGFYCKYEGESCGDNEEFGVCLLRPEVCTEIFAPVCGCDGRTYGNECEAAAAGVSVQSSGACDTDDEESICGGIAGFACDESRFCKYATGTCGAADQGGVCTAIPDFCTEIYAPVCACDETTYGNECEAERAEMSILREGACDDAVDRVCGGIAGVGCAEGEFCQLPEGQCCCDIQGVCTVMPDVCADQLALVCGCDGNTYSNPCEASRAGVSVDGDGSCRLP